MVSLLTGYVALTTELKRGDDPTKTPKLNTVALERDGRTDIWLDPHGPTGRHGLSLGRDYGTSYEAVP